MSQNVSHAVMAQRHDRADPFNFFPTPPWATRALLTYCIDVTGQSVWEPACGDGAMVRPLLERAGKVQASDIADYGFPCHQHDFLMPYVPKEMWSSVDWIITNPPFVNADHFVRRGLEIAKRGVAVLVRTVFVEGVGRYNHLYKPHPVSIMAQFSERVPMVKGRLDDNASSATAYCWMIWLRPPKSPAQHLIHIPPCRERLTRPGDFPGVVSERGPDNEADA